MIAPLAPRRWAVVLISTASLALGPAPRASFGQEAACPTPEGFGTLEATLPKTVKALASGSNVVIITLGGSSTLGSAAGGANLAWPSRLAAVLAGRFPLARVKVVNLATPRQTARDAADRLDREVLPLPPTLLIWETGTVEAVRGTDVDDFRDTVQGGIDLLHAAGTEVVLMNAQFSRDTDAMIHFAPYLTALRELADANDVPVFHRYGLMRYWAEHGVLDLRTKDRDERRRLATRLYNCLGQSVADLVTRP
ncbi:MAG: SGNH/GDSL hydrolase family protein [Candidatus Rokuibacteriota bacterium]